MPSQDRNRTARGVAEESLFRGNRLPVSHWALPGAIFAVVVAAAAMAQWHVRAIERVELRDCVRADATRLAESIETVLEEQLRPVMSVSRRWATGELATRGLNSALLAALQQHPYQVLGWVDAQNICRWVRPEFAENLLGKRIGDFPEWSEVARLARQTRQVSSCVAGASEELRPDLLAVIPLVSPDAPESPGPMLLVRLPLEPMLGTDLMTRMLAEYDIRLFGGRTIMHPAASISAAAETLGERRTLHVLNEAWELSLWPNARLIQSRGTAYAAAILPIGVVTGLFVAASTWRVLVHRSRELSQVRQHLQAMESLTEMLTAVSMKIGSGSELLGGLSESARRLLGMERAGLVLCDDVAGTVRLVAYRGEVPPGAPQEFTLDQLPTVRRCMGSGQLVFVEDESQLPPDANRELILQHRAVSLVLIPMQIEQRCIGVLLFSSSSPRRFTESDRRLAHLLGTQVSVILANNRIYEQAKVALSQQALLREQAMQDAQTKAILLRELHHRVKNNLAGIVGLLSMSPLELDPAARQWLNRVIERVQTMDRTHSLFAGGMPEVGLRELAERVLMTFSAMKPPDVSIHLELTNDIRLGQTRAVSLAMVLHELCSNAMQHGLGEKGTLSLRSQVEDGRIAIHVIDSGGAAEQGLWASAWPGEGRRRAARQELSVAGSTALAETEGGMGLMLVRELVRRELGGAFSLTPAPGGGTIATVRFPISGQKPEGQMS